MERSQSIDLSKFLASLLIVAIHTALFQDVNSQLYFVFNKVICRLAVPFFAICTGYFLSQKRMSWNLFVKQEQKLLKLYLLWTVLFFAFLIPGWIQSNYFCFENCLGYLKSTITTGAYFHLWYILYVIYSLPVFFLLVRYFDSKIWICIAAILWCSYSLGYGYSSFFPENIAGVLRLMDHLGALISAQFIILPMLLVGAYISRNNKLSRKQSFIGLIISAILLLIEAEFLYAQGITMVTRIVMFLPTSLFLFYVIKDIKIRFDCRTLGAMSIIIYCIHPMFCKYVHTGTTFIDWCLVSILSMMAAYIFIILKRKINLQKINKL